MEILLAEDDKEISSLLQMYLTNWGFKVLLVENGDDAWKKIMTYPAPSIAIIDWMMPGRDGLEICKLVRQKKTENYIYLIMLTAKDSKLEISMGLDAGADDYITKPFNKSELKSRIDVGKRLIDYKNALMESNNKLKEFSQKMQKIAEDRAKKLMHADRMTLVGTMSTEIAHEINNPNTSIRLSIEILKDFWEKTVHESLSDLVKKTPDDKVVALAFEEGLNMIIDIERASFRIKNIIENMKNFSHYESGGVENINLEKCIEDALNICMPRLKLINVEKQIEKINSVIIGNNIKITQVIVNLISNACDALEKTKSPEISISSFSDDKNAVIYVEDNGSGMSKKIMKNILNPFFTTKPKGKGTGLGLPISYSIISDDHGGTIEVSSIEGAGATFKIIIPLKPKNKK